MVKYINTCRIGRRRWAFEEGGKQEARPRSKARRERVVRFSSVD